VERGDDLLERREAASGLSVRNLVAAQAGLELRKAARLAGTPGFERKALLVGSNDCADEYGGRQQQRGFGVGSHALRIHMQHFILPARKLAQRLPELLHFSAHLADETF